MLQTERLILRKWTEEDADSLYLYASDPDVGPIAGWPPHRSKEESLSVIRSVFCGAECYAVCEKGGGKAIGAIELKLKGATDMTDRDDECELGYWLGKPYWGKGYIHEAATELLSHAFRELGMRAVWCGYYDGNEKSKRVQKKLGFVYHHTSENVPVPLLNEVRTGHTNVLTKERWQEWCEAPAFVLNAIRALGDEAYREFHGKLMPTVDPEALIGVRTPLLRKLAKELSGTPQAECFLCSLPHRYYEENNLHAFLLEKVRDYDTALEETERFLPYIDNWATCDCFSPKVFAKHKPELAERIRHWLGSDKTYTVRYAIGMLMRHYLDEAFKPEYLAWAANVKSDEYYINMMRAWYFATALAKQPDAALPWLTDRRLDAWTHRKTIQKAVESCRISPEMKESLRRLR